MKLMYYTLFVLILILQSSCAEPAQEASITEQIEGLQTAWQKESSTENANILLTKMAEYTKANPADIQTNSTYLRKSAQIYAQGQEYFKAASSTVVALRQYYQSRNTEANISDLVRYYKELNNEEAAITTMNGYLMAFPNGAKSNEFKSALGDKMINLKDQLTIVANSVVENPNTKSGLNGDAVNRYIGVTEIFALTNGSKDTLTTDYLLKAGKLAMTVGNSVKAMECYQWIYQAMPNSKESPSALFQHAFLLDNQMGKLEEARSLYESFIDKYPTHHFANDATFQLRNLGKSEAQIMEEFKKNQAKNSTK